MDADAYSCKNKFLFLKRLGLYTSLMNKKASNPFLPGLIDAFSEISDTPMDLYFGADIHNDSYIFAFWLIFGGVKRNGAASFWHYNFKGIVNKFLARVGLKKTTLLKNNILNFGIDIDERQIFYKLYYLLTEKSNEIKSLLFSRLIKDIDKKFSNFRYFYFFSQMFDKNAQCVKNKLFVEFLEDITLRSCKINELTSKAGEICGDRLDERVLSHTIKSIGGRVSLISFENNGSATFYIRPIHTTVEKNDRAKK